MAVKKRQKQTHVIWVWLKRRVFKKRILALILLAISLGSIWYFRSEYEPPATLPPPPADALYKQPNQPVDSRVEDLLSRMTLEEKIGQMAMPDKNNVTKPVDIGRYGLGAVLSGAGAKPEDNTPAGWLEMVSDFKYQAKQSRLGIPIFFGVDATHGHANVPGATVFPHQIGIGAANDTALTRSVAEATAKELAATGINWSFSPMLDAPDDIRWGRTYEAFSSSPQINANLGAAFVAGTQTPGDDKSYVLASAKHFMGVGSMKWGESNNKNFEIDQGKIPKNDALLDSQYLVPFAAAVNADVGSVMVGLTEYGDTRIIDNEYLVTEKLKNQLGFKGFVVSDWYGVYEFSGVSEYRANVKTINAGLDMAMLPYDYKAFIGDVLSAVKKSEIKQERIDDAVRRILYQKFKAGLFDSESSGTLQDIGSQAHRSLARNAVAASSVLLKNQDNTLPLEESTKTILVAGSAADNVGRQCGAWTVEWQGIDGNWLPGATSILEGIKQVAGADRQITYDKEAYFTDITTKADVGIVVIGEKPYAEGWGDNANPTLDKADIETIGRMRAKVSKVVLVTISGRPLIMTEQIAQTDATIAAWLPGSEGAGVADVLFGDKPFSASLPVAWPARIEQVPIGNDGVTIDGSPVLFDRGFSVK